MWGGGDSGANADAGANGASDAGADASGQPNNGVGGSVSWSKGGERQAVATASVAGGGGKPWAAPSRLMSSALKLSRKVLSWDIEASGWSLGAAAASGASPWLKRTRPSRRMLSWDIEASGWSLVAALASGASPPSGATRPSPSSAKSVTLAADASGADASGATLPPADAADAVAAGATLPPPIALGGGAGVPPPRRQGGSGGSCGVACGGAVAKSLLRQVSHVPSSLMSDHTTTTKPPPNDH